MKVHGENKMILDAPEPQPGENNHLTLAYISLGILALGIIFRFLHYPGSALILLAGMAGMTIRSILIFIRKQQQPFAWFYFLGRISLFVVTALYFSRISVRPKLFYLPMIFFLIGIILVMFVGKRADEEVDEDT